ncbi:MAG: YraN family protein, partial [Bacteroidetes bacterium]|nr:YraN family protein [Bacteroidota bacterium]
MTDKLEIGKKGEEIASAFLEKKGYKILEMNYRVGSYEVDIIAEKDDVIVIVEVKTR